jgi:arginyl-tRNA--protein-N-Asp/Glu arginylyltransferase
MKNPESNPPSADPAGTRAGGIGPASAAAPSIQNPQSEIQNEGASCPYPALRPPIRIRLVETGDHPCPYLPGRTACNRALWAERMPAELYHDFMDANFRRSGQVLYQPVCRGCRQCKQIRVPVATFKPGKSQRRCWRRNADLVVTCGEPVMTGEKFELYKRYVTRWHGKEDPETAQNLKAFLYSSPVDTVEYLYRDPAGRLVGVGICDLSSRSFSTVYFYHEPDESDRGLGTFAALYEIEEARRLDIPYYYLGFWIEGCPTMHYKASFRPNEVLQPNGRWCPGPA